MSILLRDYITVISFPTFSAALQFETPSFLLSITIEERENVRLVRAESKLLVISAIVKYHHHIADHSKLYQTTLKVETYYLRLFWFILPQCSLLNKILS